MSDTGVDNEIGRLTKAEIEERLLSLIMQDGDADLEHINALAERLKELEPVSEDAVKAAWHNYEQNYSGRESKYIELAHKENIQASNTINMAGTRPRRAVKKLFIIAAVIAGLLILSSVAAYAAGYNVFEMFAHWTRETFTFSFDVPPATDSADIQDDNPLHAALAENGVEENLVPNWFPDGYSLVEMAVDNVAFLSCYARYANETKSEISISIRKALIDGMHQYEKDEQGVITYERNGVTHYIMTNYGNHLIVWATVNYECIIMGSINEDECKKMIDSIYERE